MSSISSDDVLRDARYSSSSTSASSTSYTNDAPTASSIFNASIDPAALHPLAGLVDNKDLDYLLLEDDKISATAGGKSVLPSRGWGDELCYGTGTTYLAGLAAGGVWGLREGLRRPLAPKVASTSPLLTPSTSASVASPTAPLTASAVGAQAKAFAQSAAAEAAKSSGPEGAEKARLNAANAARVTAKLRWNNVLNQVTRRGSFTGNSAGVLALIYNGFNSTLDSYRGQHDIWGSMAAGAATGALWKSTAGVQPMLIASGLLTVGAAGWTTVKAQFL